MKGVSIQDRVIVSHNQPLTAVILNLQDKYDWEVIIISLIIVDHHTTIIINEPTYHSSSFPLLAENQSIQQCSVLLQKQELIVIVNVQ